MSPVIDSSGTRTSAGTVSAGYQNFLICIEMFFAAVALRYAFPHRVYAQGCVTDSRGRSVTMQSISSSLKVGLSCCFILVKLFWLFCMVCRKLWIRKILWPMPFIISIRSINNTLSTVQVSFIEFLKHVRVCRYYFFGLNLQVCMKKKRFLQMSYHTSRMRDCDSG